MTEVRTPIRSDNPIASVVIPTLGRPSLARTLDALRRQTTDEFEVIVVEAPERSVTQAREIGVEHAATPYILCTDDDCIPDKNWVTELVGALRSRDVVCVEGRVIGYLEYDGQREYIGCNLAYTREALESIDGYDERLAGWRADTDLGFRLEEVGRCLFNEHAIVNHPEPTGSTFDRDREQIFRSKHPEKYEEVCIPDSLVGKLNDWLWRNGVWKYVDKIRYGT